MHVLILTCNTGGGHNACAKAIQQAFCSKGHICDIDDSLRFTSRSFSRFLSWGHVTMYRYFPGLFRWGYAKAEDHPTVLKEGSVVYKILTTGADKLRTLVQKEKYDAVIATHVFSGLLVTHMQRKDPLPLKTAFVATDYTCSPSAELSDVDRYFIPAESLTESFTGKGIAKDRIVASGIPVGQAFCTPIEKAAAKKQMGLDPKGIHLLMTCGSMGCGPMEQLTDLLSQNMDSNMALTVACGTNKKLTQRLAKKHAGNPRVHICGMVKDMPTLMASADLYMTKPGGLSVSEAAAQKLPMVLIDAVAGCESYNLDFFVKLGAAVTADSTDGLAECCIRLMRDPEILAAMSEHYAGMDQSRAAALVASAMEKL